MIGSGFYQQKLDTDEEIVDALERRETRRIFYETLHNEAVKRKQEKESKNEGRS